MNSKPIYAISKSGSQANRILGILFGGESSDCDIYVFPSGVMPAGQPLPWGKPRIPKGAVVGAAVMGAAAMGLLAGFGLSPSQEMVPVTVAGSGLGGLAAFVAIPSAGRLRRWGICRGLRMPEPKRFPKSIPEGSFLICVRAANRKAQNRVKKILFEEGAEEIVGGSWGMA